MDSTQAIKDLIPDYAKDLRLNLDSVINRSSLPPAQAKAAALAAAFAARSPAVVSALRGGELEPAHARAALTAAALMGMNNVWYPYVEMTGDAELKTLRPELRMNAYATHGGVDKESFELYALAASIVGQCEHCIRSHYTILREAGFTTQQLRDVGRIAAVVNAVAHVLASERIRTGESVPA